MSDWQSGFVGGLTLGFVGTMIIVLIVALYRAGAR
jgi:hypothetical protein